MKIIEYEFCTNEKDNTLLFVKIPWSESAEELAKQEAYNGKYTIEDDGVEAEPTPGERLEALENAVLEMIIGG